MTDFYRFPAMAKLDKFENLQQMGHVSKETIEAMEECASLENALYPYDRTRHHRAYGMELLDVIHATETALRMEFTDEEVEELQRRVIEKNKMRGYYDE